MKPDCAHIDFHGLMFGHHRAAYRMLDEHGDAFKVHTPPSYNDPQIFVKHDQEFSSQEFSGNEPIHDVKCRGVRIFAHATGGPHEL